MTARKEKIAGLLKRYRIVDFATVVSLPTDERKPHLQNYIDRSNPPRWKTYNGFMGLIPDIMGVRKGLDTSDAATKEDIHKGLKLRCHAADLGFNTTAADALFDYVRPMNFLAFADHHRRDLRIGPDRTIAIGIEHYIVDGDRGAFQFVYPRRARLLGHVPDVLMSLIYHNYVRDDFDGFEVEIIDLSCDIMVGPRGGTVSSEGRQPRILRLGTAGLRSRAEMNEEASSIYKLLLEIGDEE